MAFPYPVGEGVWKYESLKTKSYDPANPEDFYSHIILEVVTNCTEMKVPHGTHNYKDIPHQNRAKREHIAKLFEWKRARPDRMMAMFGPDRSQEQYMQPSGESSALWAPFNWDDSMSTAWHVYLVPVRVPSSTSKVWLDLTFPLRSIYIPKSHRAKPDIIDRASYYGIKFREKKCSYVEYEIQHQFDFDIVRPKTNSDGTPLKRDIHTRTDDGFWYRAVSCTLCLDLEKISTRLALPDNDVAEEYKDIDSLIQLFTADNIDYGPPLMDKKMSWQNMQQGVILSKALSVEWGVPMTEKGGVDNFLSDLLKNTLGDVLGCIPVIGPILSFAGKFTYDLIVDPDKALDPENLIKNLPGILGAFKKSMKKTKPWKMLKKPVWKEMLKKLLSNGKKLPPWLREQQNQIMTVDAAGEASFNLDNLTEQEVDDLFDFYLSGSDSPLENITLDGELAKSYPMPELYAGNDVKQFWVSSDSDWDPTAPVNVSGVEEAMTDRQVAAVEAEMAALTAKGITTDPTAPTAPQQVAVGGQ